MFPFVGHAVWNLGTDGDGVSIVPVPGDKYSVSAAGYGQGSDRLMGGVQLFLEHIPSSPGSCFEGDFAAVVCHRALFLGR